MTKPLSDQRLPVKQSLRRERREEMRRRDQAHIAVRRRWNILIIGGIICIIVVGVIVSLVTFMGGVAPVSPTANTNQLAPPVGNIQCDAAEQLAFHTHVHLSISIDGKSVPLPAQIGITNTCFYWLHTHDTTGIIHMESPKAITLTLGTFLQLWRDRFSQLQYPNQLSSPTGWTVFLDGKPYTGDFNAIVLKSHELITLAYNSPAVQPDTVYNWNGL